MKPFNESAVSPVVGVMLMLVVTIIIAAIVAAFAGSAFTSTPKTPSASIKGTFSVSGGMQIIHAGGDTIPASDLAFEMTPDPTFGTGLVGMSTVVVNRSLIQDNNGNFLINGTTGLSEVNPSFAPGTTYYISIANCDPQFLQSQIAPCDATGTNKGTALCGGSKKKPYYDIAWNGNAYVYTGTGTTMWNLMFVNPNNIGKTFTLTVLDKRTNGVISQGTVTITA
jgi:FlaG/FlaF family flagellin (archaellin)